MIIAFVALLFMGGFIVGIVLLVRHFGLKQTADVEAAHARMAAIGSNLGGRATISGFELDLDGCKLTAALTYHKSTPTGFALWTSIDDDTRDPGERSGVYRDAAARVVHGRPRVTLRRETELDRFGKGLRLNREVQTGDPRFDDGVYIESDAADADVAAVLGDGRGRRAAMELLELGFKQVVLHDRGHTLTATYPVPDFSLLDPVRLRPAAEHLRTIARTLPRFSGPLVRPRLWTRSTVCVTGSALFTCAALFTMPWVKSAYPPITYDASATGILVGLGAWVVGLPLLVLLLRGRANSLRIFMICAVLLLAGLPLGVITTAAGVNGALDQARPVEHRTQVLGTRAVRNKSSTTYYVILAGWHDKKSVELKVSGSFINLVESGSRVVVTVGPGYFGWEWLQRVGLDGPRPSKRR